MIYTRCRTDFADIQNKKNVEVTDNGKDDFEELGGKYERQGDYLIPCTNCTHRRRTADRHMGTAASGLSEAVPQGYIHQSSHKRQAEYIPCRH